MSRRDGITADRLLELATAAQARTLTTAEAVLLRTGISGLEEARASAIGQQEALTLARAEVEQLRAGEEDGYVEATVPTPGQWIWWWNRLTPEQRINNVGVIQHAEARSMACYMGDHASLGERLADARNSIGRAHGLASELEGECQWGSNAPEIAERIRAALNGQEPTGAPISDNALPAVSGNVTFEVPGGCLSLPAEFSDFTQRIIDTWGGHLDTEQQVSDAPTVDQLNAAYRERAHLVALLTVLWPSVIILDGDPDAPGWALVYIDSPTGQLSWHLSGDDLDLFPHVPRAETSAVIWDNHTTDEKYARIRRQTADVAKFPMEPFRNPGCGPDCDGGHMYDGYCTEKPHLEGVTTPGHETPHRTGAAWSCAEDDGCTHLSLGHSSEAAARRSYDRHRATSCPHDDPSEDQT